MFIKLMVTFAPKKVNIKRYFYLIVRVLFVFGLYFNIFIHKYMSFIIDNGEWIIGNYGRFPD